MFPKLLEAQGFEFSLEKINNLIEKKTQQYQEIIKREDNLPMIDAFDQYLFFIAQQTTKIAICSGSSRNEIMAVLKKLKQGQLQTYFNTIVTSEDVKQGKPSAEGYLLAAERLNVLPEHCLVVEDTPHGVEAGKAAGMHVVALLTSYSKQKLQIADRIIRNFNELMQ